MMSNHPRFTIAVSAAMLAVAAIVGGSTAWLSSISNQSSNANQPANTERLDSAEGVTNPEQADSTDPANADPSTIAAQPPRAMMEFELSVEDRSELARPKVYWLQFEGDRLQLVPSEVEIDRESDEEVLTALMNQLLAGSTEIGAGTSAIPEGTRLLALTVEEDGVHVDVSQEFAQGGGSSSMIVRVAQVIFTATSMDPDTPVFLMVSGEPIDTDHPLGGEGLILEQPTTRTQFSEEFSLSLG